MFSFIRASLDAEGKKEIQPTPSVHKQTAFTSSSCLCQNEYVYPEKKSKKGKYYRLRYDHAVRPHQLCGKSSWDREVEIYREMSEIFREFQCQLLHIGWLGFEITEMEFISKFRSVMTGS